ncbi:hypothetical protein [Luteipulveratus mongoliensis]|uniref:hypothetical protein n=1 Tax=Luteipulveratus mongoliensis TaxID=571913 RepID=UPI000697256C|nr:hypothetical protein [Luteipulveratus mongoliensis]
MVKVDQEVLAATAAALDTVHKQLPGMLTEANGLGVGDLVGGLRGAPAWAQTNATDLRARVGLVQRLTEGKLDFGGMKLPEALVQQIAAASMPVSDQMAAVSVADVLKYKKDGTVDTSWQWDPGNENFSSYLERITAKAGATAIGSPDRQAQIQAALHGIGEFRNLVTYGAASVAAFTQIMTKGGPALLNWMATKHLIDPATNRLVQTGRVGAANAMQTALGAANDYYVRGKIQFLAPGSWKFNLAQKLGLMVAPKVTDFESWYSTAAAKTKPHGPPGQPTAFARILESRYGVAAKDWITRSLGTSGGSLLVKGAKVTNVIFGKPWTGVINGTTVTYGRNAGNLITMARAGGFTKMAGAAGGLRVLGVAGGALATADSIHGLVTDWDKIDDNWNSGTQGKAKVIGDFAEVGFNASMTAAMVAPNPYTLGAVAITGLVYGGARLVEHWPEVKEKMGEAVDWGKKKLGEVGDWGKDRIDDIKKSKVNPANWF